MDKDINTLVSSFDTAVRSVLNRANITPSKDSVKVFVVRGKIIIELPEYYKYVDSGRGAGKMPPVGVIYNWIDKKNITVPSGMSKKQFAFAIAKSIAQRGIKPRPFIDRMRLTLRSIIDKYVSDKVVRAIKINK